MFAGLAPSGEFFESINASAEDANRREGIGEATKLLSDKVGQPADDDDPRMTFASSAI
jgi:hypothetical protein